MTNMTDSRPLLEVKNLSVDFRIDRKTILHAVRDVSFAVNSGETLASWGNPAAEKASPACPSCS